MKIPTLWLTCGAVDVMKDGHYVHGEDDSGQHWLVATVQDQDCYCDDKFRVLVALGELNRILTNRDGLILTGDDGHPVRLQGK